jgi:putative endonuclease
MEYLHSRGCVLVERNVRYRVGEIDLVVMDGDCLVFVEVRRRGPGSWEAPEVALPYPKRLRLWRAIEMYLLRSRKIPERFTGIRIDYLATDGEKWWWAKNIELLSGGR